MDPNVRTLLQNVQAEFGVPVAARHSPEPSCLAEVALDLQQVLAETERARRKDACADLIAAAYSHFLGPDCAGMFPGLPARWPATRGVRHAAAGRPCVAAITTPPPDLLGRCHLPRLSADAVPGALAYRRRSLTLVSESLMSGASAALLDSRERLLRVAALTYGQGRMALERRWCSPLASLGLALPVAAMPVGDAYLLTGAADREQRTVLSALLVALLQGEADWEQTLEALADVDDSREPVLYEVAVNLAAVASGILQDADVCHSHSPEGRRAPDLLRGPACDEAVLRRAHESWQAFRQSSGLTGRRATSPRVWRYLLRLLAVLNSPQPLAIVTFPRLCFGPPRQAAWRPFWSAAEARAGQATLAHLHLPEYEQIAPLYRRPSRWRRSLSDLLDYPARPFLPRVLMVLTDDLPGIS